mmetsp:Transcript_133884/g.303676  ORF Transcript_133884/g.303676 Transcript_133884/m.303676 type:complete len:239 (-) Transcript_133884:42-758(-)
MADGRYSLQIVGNASVDGHTEYHIKVSPPMGGESWIIKRRYREIRELHELLRLKYPDRMPNCPGRRLFGNQDAAFVAKRAKDLQEYLHGVLQLEPEVKTKVLQKFLEISGSRPAAGDGPNFQQIIERAQQNFFDLAQSATSLEQMDIETRIQKYGYVMKFFVLQQPIDPIHTQRIEGGLPRISQTNAVGDNLDRLLQQPSASQADLDALGDALTQLHQALDIDRALPGKDELIAAFPP